MMYWRREAWPRSGQLEGLPDFLRPVLTGGSWSIVPVNGGPMGEAGHLLVPAAGAGGEEPSPLYAAARQYWRRWFVGGVEVWCGWEMDRPPCPADLRRPVGLDGSPVRLGPPGREQEWVIPVVHAGDFSTVPNHFVVGDDGQVTLAPEGGYEWLVTESQYWWDLSRQENPAAPKLRFFAFAAALLAVNYRVCPWLVARDGLDLLTDRPGVFGGILAAALGITAMAEELAAQKKTAIAGGGTGG